MQDIKLQPVTMTADPVKVLLLEGESSQALLMKEALEKEGFLVDICASGRKGLERIASQKYGVVVIEMQLPDLQGFEILRRIRALKTSAICVMLTEQADEVSVLNALKMGAMDFVVKSASLGHVSSLPIVIREGLSRRELRDERERLRTELWESARLLEERNTELRRANEELRRSDQVKSDLVAMVSHELRTPLSTIKEFILILSDEIAGPVTAEQHEYFNIIRSNVERLVRITNDLLDMGKIEAGRVLLNKEVLEANFVFVEVMKFMQPLALNKGLALEVKLSHPAPTLFADPDKLVQVLINLINNAISFTAKGGRITVSAEEEANEIRFSVTDTGIGIAPEDMPKLFEKFQQMGPLSTPYASKGSGLGLAISKRLVELHGGRIWATSRPGRGSTFFFTLPRYHLEEIFHEYFKMHIEQAKRHQGHFSILGISLANMAEFKAKHSVEEVYQFLNEVETLLKAYVRQRAGDAVVRWQRGEMVMVFAAANKIGAQGIAERLKRIFEEQPSSFSKDWPRHMIVSTATFPDEGATEEELLRIVERGMNRAEPPKARLLVVDDEPKIRQFIKELLELHGYEVLTAASGSDALGQLKKHSVQLILLDLVMPAMDGYELYRLLKENQKTKDIPVIVVTGKNEPGDRKLAIGVQSSHYVIKPFSSQELVGKVREALLQ
ncbi:MAG: response regulator [Candidatus Omnitrophica bacterium]|nr:response regulator [Candidatus Omnitrophota bacterium]